MFLKHFGLQKSFCGATDTPVLDFLWCLPWVPKPGWIPHLHALLPVCNWFLRFPSGVTPADLLSASMAAEPFWSTYLQIMCPQASTGVQTHDQLGMPQHSALFGFSNTVFLKYWPLVIQACQFLKSEIVWNYKMFELVMEYICVEILEIIKVTPEMKWRPRVTTGRGEENFSWSEQIQNSSHTLENMYMYG